jgi:excisionase family DNA binding protein
MNPKLNFRNGDLRLGIAWSEAILQFPNMNTITIQIIGQITLDPQNLTQFLKSVQIQTPTTATPPSPPQASIPALTGSKESIKLAYSVKETAQILGIANGTVYKLLRRRLLKSSSALRCKRIPKSEIERFLKATIGD